MASKYDGLSRIIIQNVGGKDNIQAITHCVTRLRFTLKDEGKANTDILKSTDGVVTVLQSGGQYQVVIGNHVPDVYASVVSVGHLESLAAKPDGEDNGPKEKMNPFDTFISIVTGVFTPFLGVFCACGILKGFLALFSTIGIINGAGGTYNILYSLGDAAFYFLPPILGYTAAKRFKLPEMEGLLIGLAMVYPNMLDAAAMDISNLFKIPVVLPPSGNYSSSVIPVICAVAFAAWFENLYKKYIPDTIKMFAISPADHTGRQLLRDRPGDRTHCQRDLQRPVLYLQLAVWRQLHRHGRGRRCSLAGPGHVRSALVPDPDRSDQYVQRRRHHSGRNVRYYLCTDRRSCRHVA